jgi:hypothetical protein
MFADFNSLTVHVVACAMPAELSVKLTNKTRSISSLVFINGI